MEFSRQEYWSGHFLLQRIFLTQGSNPGLPHCRQMLYHLSHQGSSHNTISNIQINYLQLHSSAINAKKQRKTIEWERLGFPGGSEVKASACNVGDLGLIPGSGRSLGREDPLEKAMATHSSILAWRIPWMEEPGGLQSMGPQESDMT